ncbi:MAG: hypothetical protein Q8O14_12935 [bacterium]|nr:hypothetical protein [bacterium]
MTTEATTTLQDLLTQLAHAKAVLREARHDDDMTHRDDAAKAEVQERLIYARLALRDVEMAIGEAMAPGGKAVVILTLGRETCLVSITTMANIGQPERAYSDDFCGAYQKCEGCKVWKQTIQFWAKDGRWVPSMVETILNRHGYRLIGWADNMPAAARSKHNSAI